MEPENAHRILPFLLQKLLADPENLMFWLIIIVNYVMLMTGAFQESFLYFIDLMWRPHTVDRFANHYNRKIVRFNSLLWVPGTEKVDAFSVNWANENNW